MSFPTKTPEIVRNKKNVVAPTPEITRGLVNDLLGPPPTIPIA